METIMSNVTVNHAIQYYLHTLKLYKGDIDGKIGPQTREAINTLLSKNKIDTTKWSTAKKLLAAEQLFYQSEKIDIGKIDGIEGPMMRHARDVFNASLVTTWRDRFEQMNKVTPVIPIKPIIPKFNTLISASHWPRQSDCAKFYGGVGKNQVTCELPFTMVLAWDTKQKVNSYSCHKLVKEPMERIWNRTLEHYGYDKIVDLRLHYFGGCLNVRKMRGGSAWSMHSWGIAVDIDPDRNSLHMNAKQATLSKPAYDKFWQFVYDEGAISLGKERNFDWMHLQFARL